MKYRVNMVMLSLHAVLIVGLASGACQNFSKTYAHQLQVTSDIPSCLWQEKGVQPFNELIVSWNALRPKAGQYTIFVRVKGVTWSGWIKYATWGVTHQQSFSYTKDDVARLNINALTMKNDCLASAFEVKVKVSGGAILSDVHWLYACASNIKNYKMIKPSNNLKSGYIEHVPKQSQMILKHHGAKGLCSPTATCTAVSYYLQQLERLVGGEVKSCEVIDPVDFVALVYDAGHHIYGNWALNVAAAYDVSGGKIRCRVERLSSFDALHRYLLYDHPVVVSIAGPLKGGATPYQHGHLMVVIGWDAKRRRVLCVDSAFRSNKATKVWYDSDEFCKAWGRRKNLSYIFMPLS